MASSSRRPNEPLGLFRLSILSCIVACSRLSVGFMSKGLISFYLYRNATHHQDDLVGFLCDVLVHPAFQVGELTLEGIIADTAQPYLVGDEDLGGIVGCESIELALG